jgi:hypothetical protein
MNLQNAARIVLKRCQNGWVAFKEGEVFIKDAEFYVFESTQSLARQLETLIGKSGWEVSMPERDAKGHFIKRQPEAKP